MTVRTPFTDDIAASFSHQGELLNFNSRGDVTYSGKKQHFFTAMFYLQKTVKVLQFTCMGY
jgi:hypothetical protein